MTKDIFMAMVRLAFVLAFVVVVLGAYVRLSHAGLGCPDWPGCYGEVVVSEKIRETEHLYPERPFESDKAWKEMVHRYTAGFLLLLIFVIAILAWRRQREFNTRPGIPTLLAVLVLIQALLGMWTVTWLRKPVIVMAHLLGGMTILALLFWLTLQLSYPERPAGAGRTDLVPWAALGIIVVVLQITLGGWTSANYAALVCPDFPTCRGDWWPAMDFSEGFTLWRGLGIDYEGGILPADARTAIHMSHRVGALITLLVIGVLSLCLILGDDRGLRTTGIAVLLILMLQVGLGIANVLLRLPLPVAVAHNGVAALLLLALVKLLQQTMFPHLFRRVA